MLPGASCQCWRLLAGIRPVQIDEFFVVDRSNRQIEGDPALAEADHPIRQQRQQGRVMDDGDQRRRGGGLAQQVADFGGRRGVERGGRLVGQNQARPLHQQAGDRHFLALAAREPVGAHSGARQQADGVQRCFGAGNFRGRETAGPAPPAGDPPEAADQHVVEGGKAGDQMQALQHLAEFPPQGAQFSGRQRLAELPAEHLDLPVRRRREAAQQTQQRRFAGAVVADDGDPLAVPHRELPDLQQRPAIGGAEYRLQRNAGRRVHDNAARIRRLRASKETTSAMTTISTVDSRPHWNSDVASVISRPSPPAPIRPRTVESRMLNSQT